MNSPFSLDGKNAWITGACYGIGVKLLPYCLIHGLQLIDRGQPHMLLIIGKRDFFPGISHCLLAPLLLYFL